VTYDSLLLDHDGVIVTLGDVTALRDAASAAFERAGISDPHPDDVAALHIQVSRDALDDVSRRYGVDPEQLWRHRDDCVEEALCAETTAGRKAPYDDVDALADLDLPMGIVSNNQTRIVEFVLDHYGLAHRFETVHARSPTPESLTRKKPRPTFLTAAMTDLDISNPLYVGDSESDVVAGRRAGLDTVYIRRDHNADRTLDVEPTYSVDDLSAVVDILSA
jgi:HAD superfamily hydrolase (TIGR01549 family)